MGRQGRTDAGHALGDTSSLPKTETGVAGLDNILEGGLPTGRTTLIHGGPGTGKNVLVLKSRGAKHSNNCHQFLITDDGVNVAPMARKLMSSAIHNAILTARSAGAASPL